MIISLIYIYIYICILIQTVKIIMKNFSVGKILTVINCFGIIHRKRKRIFTIFIEKKKKKINLFDTNNKLFNLKDIYLLFDTNVKQVTICITQSITFIFNQFILVQTDNGEHEAIQCKYFYH